MRTVTATRHVDIEEIADGWNVVNVTVGPTDDLVCLFLEQPLDYRKASKGASFAKSYADHPNNFRICHIIGETVRAVDLPATRENFHFVQPLGSDQWLLVRSRSDSKSDLNAHIYSGDGKWLHAFHAGDGIQDVQITSNRDIWISFFDEGVFGGDEMGHPGVVCFSDYGQVNFTFSSLRDVPGIADCYAMNVADQDEAWFYYYSDFPLVRLKNKQIGHVWPEMPIHGSSALAVSKDRVLLSGSYNRRDALFLVSLFPIGVEEYRLLNSQGEDLSSFLSFGRGSKLYLQQAMTLSVVDLNEMW